MFIINWILPIIYWTIGIWFVEGALDNPLVACNVIDTTLIMIHQGCGLIMSSLGLIFGCLIKRHYSKGKMTAETKKNLRIYLGIIISYFAFFLLDIILKSKFNTNNKENTQSTETTETTNKFIYFYDSFRNLVCVILPDIFFLIFCFSVKRTNKSVFKQTSIAFNNNSMIENSFDNKTVTETTNNSEGKFCTEE